MNRARKVAAALLVSTVLAGACGSGPGDDGGHGGTEGITTGGAVTGGDATTSSGSGATTGGASTTSSGNGVTGSTSTGTAGTTG